MPVNPDGQQDQTAAQLGGMVRPRLGERSVDVVPLLLRAHQIMREGEALHPLIRSHVRIMGPVRRRMGVSGLWLSASVGHGVPQLAALVFGVVDQDLAALSPAPQD